jgi:peptidoglycan/LPS O-acetylase OafA/YrhL
MERLAGAQQTRLPRLAEIFDPRDNALNAIRLLLATWVILWHSLRLTGGEIGSASLRQLAASSSVDGFFAISGYLIVSSWLRDPNWFRFLRARVLRIFPAFWVSLVLTALVIAPLALYVQPAVLPSHYWREAVAYVTGNSLLWVNQYDIAGTPAGVPLPGVWNGSMWTLSWEFFCYMGVLAAGVAGLFRWRISIPAVFVLMEVAVLATSYGPIDNLYVSWGSHFGIFFAAGALVHQLRAHLPVSAPLLLAAAGLVLGSLLLPDYRVLAALPGAYLIISVGALLKGVALRNDFSYGTYIYAFPIQQLLLAWLGAATLGVAGLAALSLLVILPLAAASWFIVERPAMKLKQVQRPQSVQRVA